MKNLILFLLLIVTTSVTAQNGPNFKHIAPDDDTLGVNTTLTYDINTLGFLSGNGRRAQDLSDRWYYNVTVWADSLSGANSDSNTVFLQFANTLTTDTSPEWHTANTTEIDGTANQLIRYTGETYDPRMQVVVYSKSGTKAIRIRTRVSLWRIKD